MHSTPDRQFGAYGLRLSGVPAAEHALVEARGDWPEFTILVEEGVRELESEHVDEATACVRLRTGGWIELDRSPGRALFTVPVALSADELVHPYLAPVAAVASHWFGRESLHGGGIVVAGRVWGVLGDRHDGKSSLLAALATRGTGIVSDDVLVVEGSMVFAGPRTLDLRREAANALGVGEHIGMAGARERWRLTLGPLVPSLPLAGWIFLRWAEKVTLTRLPAATTLRRLLQHRGIRIPPVHPESFLQLSTLPAWELSRPRSWEAMPDALDRLLEAAS